MGAKGSCEKTTIKTPFGSVTCNGCGSSCVKEPEQESPEDIAQQAKVQHTLDMIGRLVASESSQVQNNFGSIVKELLQAGVSPHEITVEHQVHSPKPGVRMMTTRIRHTGDTPPESPKDIVHQSLPRSLYQVEDESKASEETPPPDEPPTLIRQDAIIPKPPRLVRQ